MQERSAKMTSCPPFGVNFSPATRPRLTRPQVKPYESNPLGGSSWAARGGPLWAARGRQGQSVAWLRSVFLGGVFPKKYLPVEIPTLTNQTNDRRKFISDQSCL